MLQYYTAPHVRRLEDLSELEQQLFYTRILCTHFNYLYQHLTTPAILETLRELIEPDALAQNALAIHSMLLITAPLNCMEKL